MNLYSFFRSSAAYRVRIALNLKGLEYDQIPVHFRKDGGQHRSPMFLNLNPQGLLPVIDDNGFVLQQSLAIIEYLDEQYPETSRLVPRATRDRAVVRAMSQMVACDLHPLNNLRVLNYLRQDMGQSEESIGAWYRHWVRETLGPLEELVGQHGGACCFGDEISLVDVCIVPQLYNARRFDCDVDSFPHVIAIDKHLRELPPFAAAAPEAQPDFE
ncbi:MAG: maleylacetoacetate isomerase [SAR92 bacterium BACL16 MAG-120619-bin48]|jgi:maleylacetoacetate isomerase|nr:MAG: maleylacetoacetate isomerase [SAR92 bacterium BACL16 MAG-120619-bin48]